MFDFGFMVAGLEKPFVERARALGLRVEVMPDPAAEEVTIVRIHDDLSDALQDELEALYEAQEARAEQWLREHGEADLRQTRVALAVPRADGGQGWAELDPSLMRRLQAGFSADEIDALVHAIAGAALSSRAPSLCGAKRPGQAAEEA